MSNLPRPRPEEKFSTFKLPIPSASYRRHATLAPTTSDVDRLQLGHFGTEGVRSLRDYSMSITIDPLPSFPHCLSTRPIVWIFSLINRSDPRHCAKQPRLLIHIVIVEPPFG
ncbi:hypothetical protein PAXINDRAFT_22339 [Paxillus involutus ATCC 200175]|uniref:Uncharacterized protein n=1 Tax=Paxillus involutus ATCC 200175 TaxID=664439 RepID=A0A0C9TAS3_PAXIN|nr:hypothetical protein PAXINDRAFT_22339 [Paxillus involutus ATCC 200175]